MSDTEFDPGKSLSDPIFRRKPMSDQAAKVESAREEKPFLWAIETSGGYWKDGESCVFGDLASCQDEVDTLNDELPEDEGYRVVPLYRRDTGQTLLDQHGEERESRFAAMIQEMSSAIDACKDVPQPLINAFEKIVAQGGGALERHDEELLRPMRELVEKVNQTRTAWLEQHGVPISQEFVDFANAIGDLLAALPTAENATTRRIDHGQSADDQTDH